MKIPEEKIQNQRKSQEWESRRDVRCPIITKRTVCTVGVDGGDPSAASKNTRRDRAAHDRVVATAANLSFLDRWRSKAVYQLVLSIEMSTESNSSQRANSTDVLEIRQNDQKPLLLRQNVILTWTSFSDRKQGGSDEKLRLFIEMNFSAAAIIDKTSIFVLENHAVYSVNFIAERSLSYNWPENFEILGQRIPYFAGFSTSF
ncbi:hypothetical protein Y032_0106g3733 [Ancylostoma ceylanicum]|uniref:Uncharacterized protein n=1 Tax=Ancylostoma ceylanicum TaxID=53326 RepID=A0A016TEZ2_9BILA|nr:hypothetical protein Y032_0106g3733 [Ancylostoma ceylanicum]